ncbi:cytochrome P450 [Mycolicibacterium celeriflavum]|uniref:Steroid C26-monooxygenase n=1 Tax=Mycolicibacterium celeriflavum TaxID=1249101 RepID=A0A1X0C2N8_MYCCF|nr:cytochrome P450 [Mycolicibacterium celeriflavum]MCV7239590.1 cytochrome P450 [Mycolicibacterium celeriflavum]ORA51587.1 cytochrome [Mycolicibacterium celeriflavum]BBY43282.1 cytochrome P450 [Mycolicibacterium celeriflavum]
MTASTTDLYYDPFDFAIDDDPYPIWKRMRDEAPLYYNEKYDFYALSRYEDVARELHNWDTYRSGKGTTMDVIKSGVDVPPGVILFEDPPLHDLHRRVLSKVFTPRRMEAIEPLTRQFCVRALDSLAGASRFDIISDFGALIPMRTIGYLLGIPEEGQQQIRDTTDASIGLTEGSFRSVSAATFENSYQLFADYIEWRAEHPSDDLMTQLLNAQIEDGGELRALTRIEVLTYTSMIAGAGNETTTRLIGFIAQLLAQHPDQRRELVEDFSLIPRAIEEVLRYESPSPVQARYVAQDTEVYGQTIGEGSVMLLLNGSANRDERNYPDGESFYIHRIGPHLSFGQGLHFCLGSSLARMQASVALEEMLKRWPEWEIDLENAAMAHTSSVRGWGSLPVVLPNS